MKSFNTKTGKILMAVIAVAVLAGLVVFLAWPKYRVHSARSATASSNSYTYSRLDNYQVSGFLPGTGMSFSKPIEFTSVLQTNKAPIADLSHIYGKDKISIAEMVAYSQPDGPGMDKASLAKVAADPSNPKYESVWLPPQQFAAQRLVNLDLHYQDAQPLGVASLKDAWVRPFTSSIKSKIGPDLQKQGVLIIAAGQKTDYYFLIDALNGNWQNNQQIWQKIYSSIRIDQ